MLTTEEIKKLKNRRFTLRDKIKAMLNQNQNATELVKQYINLCETMKSNGIYVKTNSEYLTLQYWENWSIKNKTSNIEEKSNTYNIPNNEPKKIENKNYYIINIAWQECPCEQYFVDSILLRFKQLLANLNIREIEHEQYDYNQNKEHILKFEAYCEENAYKMLIMTLQSILDVFVPKIENINIGIYGKLK